MRHRLKRAIEVGRGRFLPALAACTVLAGPAAAAELRLPADVTTAPGEDVLLAVTVDDGAGISGASLEILFDPEAVAPIAVYPGDGDLVPLATWSGPGVFDLELAGATPLGDGPAVLARIAFRAVGGDGSGSALVWGAAVPVPDDVAFTTVDGAVWIDASRRSISVPDAVAVAVPGTVDVDVSVDDANGALAFDVWLAYDPSVVVATDIAATSLTGSLSLTANLDTPGIVRAALFGSQPLAGGGPILRVTFETVGPAGGSTPLDLTRGLINEGQYPTTLDDGWLRPCAGIDADGDGFGDCTGDCDDGRSSVFPGAEETCDGRDNDCNALVDDGIALPSTSPRLELSFPSGTARLAWSEDPGASGYDVVRGSLDLLRATADPAAAVEACLASGIEATLLDDPAPVASGGNWYLVRPVNCAGVGSWNVPFPEQLVDRDSVSVCH